MRALVGLAVLLVGTTPALASGPRLLSLADTSRAGLVGVELEFGALHFFEDELIAVTTTTLIAEVPIAPHLEVTAAAPVCHAVVDGVGSTGIGNLTLGARVAGTRDSWSAALSTSVSAPTAARQGAAGEAVGLAARLHFATDPGRFQASTTTLRAAATLRYDAGRLLVAAEARYRLHIFMPDAMEHLSLVSGTIAGGASLTRRFAVLGELTTMTDLLEVRYAGGDHFYHVAAVGLRYSGDHASVAARVSVPLDYELRDNQTPIAGFEIAGAL